LNRRLVLSLGALWLASLASPPRAAELLLGLPVVCSPEDRCSIQNYVDLKQGPGLQDFGCGVLTYDGHRGTDFQVRDLARMRAGVPAVAAAPGVVRSVRDQMPDSGKPGYDAAGETDRALGNAVAVDHGDGWTSVYGHLRNGSLKVRPGDRVEKGQALGEVGLSGNTEFPHLHFEVRRRGVVIDPFTGTSPGSSCGTSAVSLWQQDARALLPYSPTGVICAGWSASAPDRSAVLEDCERPLLLFASSPAIVAWIELYGVRKGDHIRVLLTGPDGTVLAEASSVMEKDRARQFRYVGKKRPAAGWRKGTYRVRYSVTRTVHGERNTVIDITREAGL
jgi:Peptidase family M23